VPIGGGGLISGIATAARALKPELEVVGVEAALYPSMSDAVHGRSPSSGGLTLAEGIAVKTPGALTRPIIERLVADILLVEEAAIEGAVHCLAEQLKLVAEGAGAAGVAALQSHPQRSGGRRVGIVICGGNIDTRMLAQVLMRGLVRDGRVATLRVEISDSPGVLGALARTIGESGGNIIEIHHQRLFYDLPVKRAEVDAVIETRNAEHVREIMAALARIGFTARRLSSRSADQ
jgi:threonine dehydratase